MNDRSNKKINGLHSSVSKLPRRRNFSSGLVIVTVLWVVILLGVIAATIGRSSRLDAKVSLANIQGLKLRWACNAGIDTALAVLNEDGKASDNLQDLWSDNEDDFNIELDGCDFEVEVVDEASKLNVNTATKNQLLGMPDMTEEIADSIMDWRDDDSAPSQSGVEGGYYESLRYGYKIRNGPFRTIRELLLVKGVNSELLYGQQTRWVDYLTCYSTDNNKDANGENRININKADENKLTESLKIKKSYSKWIVENRPKDKGYGSIADLVSNESPSKTANGAKMNSDSAEKLDLETFYEIADKITVTDDEKIAGRININTASRDVLIALLGGDDKAERLSESIITYRKSLVVGMESIADIMKVSSMKIETFKKIANYITIRSDIYSVYSIAKSTEGVRAKLASEAVIDRSTSPNTILYRYQGVSN